MTNIKSRTDIKFSPQLPSHNATKASNAQKQKKIPKIKNPKYKKLQFTIFQKHQKL